MRESKVQLSLRDIHGLFLDCLKKDKIFCNKNKLGIFWTPVEIRDLSFFTRRGGPSVCDRPSSIFSVPPFDRGEKTGPPLANVGKILVPPFDEMKKILVPPSVSKSPFHIRKVPFNVVYSTTCTDMYHLDIQCSQKVSWRKMFAPKVRKIFE